LPFWKKRQFGGHIVSGAICNLQVIAKLFPDFESQGFPHEGRVEANHLSVLGSQQRWDLPEAVIPPGFRKQGQFILTLSHVIRWLAETLQEKAKGIPNVTLDVFPGFAAHEILYEGERVIGVRASDSGQVYEDCIFAELTCFGDKGFISKDLIEKFQLRPNPQLWSVGVKEVWQIPQSLQGQVWHTLGYPVLDGSFSGGFVYGLKDNRLALGLIIGLDSKNPNLNPQQRLQEFKAHPWIQSLIAGGRLLKYGAAVIPEGGYHSLPTRFGVEGALLLGDALGVLDVGSLAGVDNAMETGYLAAGLIHDGFLKGDLRIQTDYQKAVMESAVGQNLYRSRYFREAFLENSRLLEEYLPQVCRSVDAGHPGWDPCAGVYRIPFAADEKLCAPTPCSPGGSAPASHPREAMWPPTLPFKRILWPPQPWLPRNWPLDRAISRGPMRFFSRIPATPRVTVTSWSSTPKPAAGASPPTTS